MLRILGFLLIALLFSSCENSDESEIKDGYKIVGNVENLSADSVFLVKSGPETQERVTGAELSEDGQFILTGKIDEPGYYALQAEGMKDLGLILENEKAKLSFDANDPVNSFEIKGLQATREYFEFAQQLNKKAERRSEMSTRLEGFEQASDSAAVIQERISQLDQETMEYIKSYVDSIMPSLAAVPITTQYLRGPEHLDFHFEVANRLKDEFPNVGFVNDYAQTIQQIVDSRSQTSQQQGPELAVSPGDEAPEISLPNPEGETVSLSDLRGNYVLIDFWASWCGPCRRENPNVVRVYNQYKDEGFEIYGVSLDRDRDKWLQAIEADNLGWVHVSDLQYWQSEAAQKYGVNSIPSTVLVNPEGEVEEVNLRGAALEQKLNEIYGES